MSETYWPALLALSLVAGTADANGRADPTHAISPVDQVLRPFRDNQRPGTYTWLKQHGRADPDRVFQIEGDRVHVSGQGSGYIATEKAYKNYHLSVEYRWGKRTDGSRFVRNSGVLLHAVGPDGGARGVWMTSFECQLAQGCEGDLIVIRGQDEGGKVIPATVTSETVLASDGKTRWKKAGEKTLYSGKQLWWSKHQVGFDELLDTRGRDDLASPLGQWTRVECICDQSTITIKINGVTVNQCFDVYPSAGKILLQNESNEVDFRNFELRPLSRTNQ